MKVLFICKANVGRSQMAEAIFNNFTMGKASAISAGVDPGSYEGKMIEEVGPNVAACMNLRHSENARITTYKTADI